MNAAEQNRLSGLFDLIPQAVSVIAVAVGVLVLLGWLFDLDALKSVLPGLAVMKANTAFGFILSGVALWTAQAGNQGLHVGSRVCAGLVLLLGLLTLGEYLSGADFGIDQLLIREITNLPGDIPGRMAVNTALSFAALGAALLLLSQWKGNPAITIHALAMVPILAAGSALIGYGYDIDEFLRVKLSYTPMAENTAAAFVLLALGIVNARSDYPFRRFMTSGNVAGITVRRLLPAAIVFTLLTGWLLQQGYRAGYYSEAFVLALFTVASIAGLSTMILWNAGRLYEADVQRERAEEELRKYHEHLEELVRERTSKLEMSNKDLEEFVYSISHDLRVPLRAVDGFSRMLLSGYEEKLDNEGKRLLNVVRINTKRMEQIIDDILAFSRMGQIGMSASEVDMKELARAVFEELKPCFAGRKLTLEVKPLPLCRGDLGMLRQVWANLMDNAIKFTRPRAAALVEVGGRSEGTETIYYVRDNGAGFDMQYAAKLFGAFQRLHGVEEFEGAGIGLAIVKRIITRHGGRVWAEGKVDEGATFYFALPIERKIA